MTKEKIINYAMSTPHNTNESVLSAIIDKHDKETLNNAGFVKTVNGQGPDEQGNVDVAAAASWDDLERKPFGEEILIPVFDENLNLSIGYNNFDWTAYDNFAFGEKYHITIEKDGKVYTVDKIFTESTWNYIYIMDGAWALGFYNDSNGARLYLENSPLAGEMRLVMERYSISQLNPKFLPEHSHKWEDIENPPFGEEEPPLIFSYPEQSELPEDFKIIFSKTYTVIYNGEVFKVEGDMGSSMHAEDFMYIGNGKNICSDWLVGMNFPFTIYTDNNCFELVRDERGFITASTSDTIKLYDGEIIVNTLDPKFLPNEVITEEKLNTTLTEKHTWESLPDKPFYSETVENAIVFEKNVQGNKECTPYYMQDVTGDWSWMVDVDEFTILFDNVEYTLPVVKSGTNYFAGNRSIADSSYEDTGEPICIYVMEAYKDRHSTIDFLDGEVHNLKCISDRTTTKVLDAKFLPKVTAISDVTEAPTAEQFNALLAALRAAGYMAE